MRSFSSIALRQVRARKMRSLLTAAGIVLGVAMIFGVLTLASTISRTFTDLFDSVYGRADLVVSGTDSTSLPKRSLRQVRSTAGVEEARGNVFSSFSKIQPPPEPPPIPEGLPPGTPPPPPPKPPKPDPADQLNVVGEEPGVTDLTDATLTVGRRPREGLELMLQESWASEQEIEAGDRLRLATPAGKRRFRITGLFQFSTGLDFGGQGFATMPISSARRVMDKGRGYDEIDIVVAGGGDVAIDDVKRELRRKLEKGARVLTPDAKSEDVESQLQAFNAILYFFAAMALFVGGFLIFNAFNMTVLQRTREIGMLRTLGATPRMVVANVLREAVALGVVGSALGAGLGILLAVGLVKLMRDGLGFPIGDVVFTPVALIAAITCGLATAILGALLPARRAGSTSPIRAVLGGDGLRARPRRRRAVLGLILIGLGLGGAFWLGAADETTPTVAAAGMGGTIAIFLGISICAPFVISPFVRVLAWPLRRASPVAGRLAADSARSDPGRTASTATGLMIGLALVIAVNSLGASFLDAIEGEFDRSFARDLTVQPNGFSPGEGPQQTISKDLRRRLAKLPEASVVAQDRILYSSNLPAPKGKRGSDGLILAFNPATYREVDTTEIDGAPREEVFDRMERGEVTLGRGHADETGLEVGDTLELDGPSGSASARVAGIVETVIFGGQTVGMSLETMRKVYGVTADSELALKAVSPELRPELERKVERILVRDYPNLTVLSNEELKANVEQQINEQFGIFYAIVGVAIFASLFGIINTLSMSVLERTREIGVLRALGSTRWQVRRQVAAESLVIGLIGALLGIAVGTGLGWALLKGLAAGIPGVEYTTPFETMVWVAVAGLVLGLIASVLPARRAARMDVISALSYE
ncbi:MAG: ABC transporter permease [Solirubrobacterales bacterium]